ncbi:MAG: NADH-quinone oxidoreductase subunit NuoG [Desulfuromonadales bacterium]
MPKLTIDNREVTVPEGTNVLEAARGLGIVIPHFCYHEALGAVGACRLCAMTFAEGPVKGIQMACMVKAQDGMVVSTTDPAASELRAHVIEWLMMSHPHDCPVCDEGGECQLQDMTIAGGHGLRRYRGLKRTFVNQDLGPFIEHEMNRCITCYRCVRTYREYCGGTDFGAFGSRDRVFFGRFREGRLESPFSGNLVDVCPTGVFTDKTFRFKSRFWDLQEAPSIYPHCSLGCRTIPGGRYRELQRVRAGMNPETNGFFICDRGRFGSGYVNHPDRPRTARIDDQTASVADAIKAVRERVTTTIARYGPQSVAFLGSSRASFEANALLRQWAASCGAQMVLFEANQRRDLAARAVVARVADQASRLADVRDSDLIVLIGADPLAEAPVLALAIRQAARRQARVVVLDPRPVALPCRLTHLTQTPAQLVSVLEALRQDDFGSWPEAQQKTLKTVAKGLQEAERPVLIGGADLLGAEGVAALHDTAEHFATTDRSVGVMTLLAGPNSFGGAVLADSGPDFETLCDDLQEGHVKALVCLQSDPFREARDPAKSQVALGHLELLVSIDATPSLAAHRADIFLPARATVEMAGSYINNEGRLQAFLPVIDPGEPIRVSGQGDHPPREFSSTTPGSEPVADWQLLAGLLDAVPDLAAVREQIARNDPRFAGLVDLQAESEGQRLTLSTAVVPTLPKDPPETSAEGTLPLLPTTAFIGSDWLAHLSTALEPLRPEPQVWLHPEQASRLDLAHGDRVVLTTHLGHCHEGMSPGEMIVCRLEKERGR